MDNGEQYLAQQIQDLKQQWAKAQMEIEQLRQANDLTVLVGNGFRKLNKRLKPVGKISAQLGDLRDLAHLAPRRFQLPADTPGKITHVLGPMTRPEFGGGDLGLPRAHVQFIGAGQPPQQLPPPPEPPPLQPARPVHSFADVMDLLRPDPDLLPPQPPKPLGGKI